MFPALLLAIAFFFPPQFSLDIFGVVLQPYRVLLLCLVGPAVARLYASRSLNWTDGLILLIPVPVFASMINNLGGAGIVSGALISLEITGTYLVARAYLATVEQFLEFFRVWTILCVIFLPLMVIEAWTHQYLVAAAAAEITGNFDVAKLMHPGLTNVRLGLLRAQGPFGHPILAGIAYASLAPYALLVLSGPKRGSVFAVSILGVLASVSSDAIIVVFLVSAVALLLWSLSKRPWRAPVTLVATIAVPPYVILQALSSRSLFLVVLTRLSLNSWTGYYRSLIWRYGSANIWEHPFLGIGYGDWARPRWMIGSVDAYWLLIGMRHGVLPLAILVGCCLVVGVKVLSLYGNNAYRQPRMRSVGALWLSVFVGYLLSGLSVDYWGPMAMIMPLLLGVGRNILDPRFFCSRASAVQRPGRGMVETPQRWRSPPLRRAKA